MKLFLPLTLSLLALPSWAQETPTFSTTVNLVSVLATVHDRDGRLITDLNQSDFLLREDGKAQTPRYFSRETDLPLTVGLLVDTSRSQSDVLGKESEASAVFLHQVLEPKDQAFIVHFDTAVDTLQGLTASQSDLSAALVQLRVPDQVATLLYSAVQQSSNNVLRGQKGRKAVILLTDGVAWKDPSSIQSAIEAAQRSDVMIFSIRFSGPVQAWHPLRAGFMEALKERGRSELERMSRETGGIAYQVDKDHSIEQIYAAIAGDLRSEYSLGYTPGRLAPDGKYHRIQLATHDRNLIVDARAGYYAK